MKTVTTKFGKFEVDDNGKIKQLTFPKGDLAKKLNGKTAEEVADIIIEQSKK